MFEQCAACGVHQHAMHTRHPEVGLICKHCAQSPTPFSTNVVERICHVYEVEPSSKLIVNREALALEQEGFTVDQAFRILRNIEEVNPHIDEPTALRNMRAVREEAGIWR